jgi:DNA-binding SARP family transcriptional activator
VTNQSRAQTLVLRRDQAIASASPASPEVQLFLLGGFRLEVDGLPVSLPAGVQRLVAFLGLHRRPLRRVFVAATLWMDADDERAMASLRSALWRLNRPDLGIVDVLGPEIALAKHIRVDHREALDRGRDLVDLSRGTVSPEWNELLPDLYVNDVLPDWYEEWAVLERERFRQVRLHVLERMCERLTDAGFYALAVLAGLAAVEAEPLRESAHRVVMRAYAAEGNAGEAIRQYRSCRDLLARELGVEPSPQMERLLLDLSRR